jgi:cardiolipin synthase
LAWGGTLRASLVALLGALCAAGCALHASAPLPAEAVRAPGPPVVRDGTGLLKPAEARRVVAALVEEGGNELLRRHLAAEHGTVDSPLVLGNAARLLVDGPQTHTAMFTAIARAQDHVNLQSYIIADDNVGRELADLLIHKRKEGVRVNVMYDGVGSLDTPKEFFQALRDAGIATCEFNPVNPLEARGDWRLNNRNHRKILVVDGRVAFTGGINISGVYSAGSFGSGRKSVDSGWRDTHIRVEGPAVSEVQHLFLDAWKSQEHCDALQAARFYPDLEKPGTRVVRVLAGAPDHGSETYAALMSAIDHAAQRAWLTYGYFVPDERTIKSLQDAARRGVEVKLLLPGFSDFWAPLYAGRSHYTDLLESGVRIYERRDALLHAKTAVVDGVWATVGSTNLDWRSLVHNYEADVIVLGDDFGAQMEELYTRDLQRSREVTLESWRQRGPGERVREWLARAWAYWL